MSRVIFAVRLGNRVHCIFVIKSFVYFNYFFYKHSVLPIHNRIIYSADIN